MVTHRSSKAIIWGYPQVVKGYSLGAPIGPQRLLYGSIHRSSRAILVEGVPIDSEESKAIKGKAKGGWGYKDIRLKAIWNIKIFVM